MEKKQKKPLLTVLILFLAVLFFATDTEAASLYFSPLSGTFSINENFTVRVLVNTDAAVNAVSGLINFPTEYLEVISLNTAGSAIDFWVQDPSFSNRGVSGNVHFEGVILNPGYTGTQGRMLNIVFRAKKLGTTSISFNELSILANDGAGTNIASASGSASFSFIDAPASQPKSGLDELEEKINTLAGKEPIVIVQESAPPDSFIEFLNSLPLWIKVVAFISIGFASLVFLFISLSFFVITLIWFVGHFRHKGAWMAKRSIITIKNIFRKPFAFLGFAKKELEGDIAYSIFEIEEQFKQIKTAPSFVSLVKSYRSAVFRIIRRFLVINIKKNEENDTFEF